MIPDNVTLIVKAPNQQIEDQNIECQTSWTVKQLKGHLSEVYPSKPKTEEQKIIYSGQLLDDNSVLKDVLRNYEQPIPHTMHLVCTSKTKMDEPKTDGLRNRHEPRQTEAVRPEMRQNDQNHTVEMQNYLSSFVNNYGRVPPYQNYNFNDRYLPMQQAYMEYMQQYANLWQAYAVNGMPPHIPPQTAPAPAAAPPAPQAPAREEERDWLDHLYVASRVAVLVSLLYLYGSPARLLLLVILVVTGYLHQIGFFRDLLMNPNNVQQNERNAQANPNPQGANPVPQGENPAPQAANPNPQGENPAPQEGNPNPQGANPVQQGADPAQETPDPSNQNPPDDDQSLLAVTWTIFTTFFASLIPEAN